MINNNLSASRMSTLIQCPRRHYWAWEIGIERVRVGVALRMGKAWAKGMEARWSGASYAKALRAALPRGVDLDAYDHEVVAALLAAYYRVYSGEGEIFSEVRAEQRFERSYALGFKVKGYIDGIGVMADGRHGIIESKTTSASLSSDSDYWLRLNFNLQVLQYVVESRHLGWNVSAVFYDVTRKPEIRPKQVVVKKKKRTETAKEFGERLVEDAVNRPDFYFARREIPIIEHELEAFEAQRMAIARLILHFRLFEPRCGKPEQAWPKNVSEHTCNFCDFKSFCLRDQTLNPQDLPEGFKPKGAPACQPENNRTT